MVKVTVEGESFASLLARSELQALKQLAEGNREHVMELVGRILRIRARQARDAARKPVIVFTKLPAAFSAKLRGLLRELEIPHDHVDEFARERLAGTETLKAETWFGSFTYRYRAHAVRVVLRLAQKGGQWPAVLRRAMHEGRISYYAGDRIRRLRIDLPDSKAAPAMECPTSAGR